MNIKVKDLVNSTDITKKIKNAVNGMDYKATYLVEFGNDSMAKVTEIEIVNHRGVEVIWRK